MKILLYKTCLLFILIIFLSTAYTQNNSSDSLKIDSLKKVLLLEKEDTNKVNTLINTGTTYKNLGVNDESLSYYFNALKLAEQIKNQEGIFHSLYAIADFYMNQSDNDRALEYALKGQQVAEQQNNKDNLYKIYDLIGGFIYFNEGKYNEAFEYGRKMMKLATENNDREKIRYMEAWFGDVYRLAEKPDSSIIMYKKALQTAKALGNKQAIADCLHGIGMAYVRGGNYKDGINYYLQSLEFGKKEDVFTGSYLPNIAQAYLDTHKYDSALFYGKAALAFDDGNYEKMRLLEMISRIYLGMGNYKEAYFNQLHFIQLKDSISSIELQNKMDAIQNNYKTEKQTKELDFLERQAKLQNTLRNVMITASILLIIILVLIANKYREKRKSEIALSSKNNELTKTLEELNSTQAQLIQSEKMASLGELTAGIAHEIQNPLNFVNNFSEVNEELIIELVEGIDKGNTEEVKAIANDIKDNSEKINYHGKRADAIVKGMLQHSRKSEGKKEPTDINTLCDEYLRLSYHGFRAKDKSFNSEIKTDFDKSINKINIIPQDIGRVLLNLYNNAFYATKEKFTAHRSPLTVDDKPFVSVQTKKINDKVEIIVSDNGNGIPQIIVDKIFQPFFTTKPTGQGTGLGLSLSYDIIKAHGGEIKVTTKEGEGSEFIIQLPFV